jgi:ABC-type transporter Mla subunit MlaD
MSISTATANLETAIRNLAGLADMPPFNFDEAPAEIQQLHDATGRLLEALSGIERSAQEAAGAFSDLAARLEDNDIVEDLTARLNEVTDAAKEAIDDSLELLGTAGEELAEHVTGEVEQWCTEAADELTDAFRDAIDEVADAATDGAAALVDGVADAISDLGDQLRQRIEQRTSDAVHDVVETATDRALTEVAETVMTSQIGVTITSAIGPYLPAVIALKPALPAIQDALDVMRGGF